MIPKYKVLILSRLSRTIDTRRDVEFWKEFMPENFGVGLDVEYTVKQTDIPFVMQKKVKNSADGTVRDIWTANDIALAIAIRKVVKEGEYDEVVFAFDTKLAGLPAGSDIRSNCPYTVVYPKTALVTLCYRTNPWKILNHERFHALERRAWHKGLYAARDQMDQTLVDGTWKDYYKDNDIEALDGNRAATIKIFKPFWGTMFDKEVIVNMPTGYKYFRPEEIVGLKPEFVQMLDATRGTAGVPFVIESGLRSAEKNEAVGGVEDSAHLRGYAADIRCKDSVTRWKMVNAALQNGFKRIGIGENFIHLDCDPSKPQSVIWHYYK